MARLQAGPGLPLGGGASQRPPGQPVQHSTGRQLSFPPGNQSCCPARTLLPPGQAPVSAAPLRPACGPRPVRPPAGKALFALSPGAVSPPPGSPHRGFCSLSSLLQPWLHFCLWCSGSCPLGGLDRAPCVGSAAHQGRGLGQRLKGTGLSKLVMRIHRAGLSGSRVSPILRDLFEEGSGPGGTAQLAGS